MTEFLIKIVATFILGLVIIGSVAAFGHHIVYAVAFLIAAVVVFGGWLILDEDWIS